MQTSLADRLSARAVSAGRLRPLPRPFQPDTKTANPLTGIKDGELLVLPITRQAPGDPFWIAMTLADALRSRNLPATIQHPGPRAKRLSGRAVVRAFGAGTTRF